MKGRNVQKKASCENKVVLIKGRVQRVGMHGGVRFNEGQVQRGS